MSDAAKLDDVQGGPVGHTPRRRTAPRRKIINCCETKTRTRRGILQLATLECGHLDRVNASARRRGHVYCFDCFYDKPKHSGALIILAEKGISPCGNNEPEISDAQRGWERAIGLRGYAGSPAEREDREERIRAALSRAKGGA